MEDFSEFVASCDRNIHVSKSRLLLTDWLRWRDAAYWLIAHESPVSTCFPVCMRKLIPPPDHLYPSHFQQYLQLTSTYSAWHQTLSSPFKFNSQISPLYLCLWLWMCVTYWAGFKLPPRSLSPNIITCLGSLIYEHRYVLMTAKGNPHAISVWFKRRTLEPHRSSSAGPENVMSDEGVIAKGISTQSKVTW